MRKESVNQPHPPYSVSVLSRLGRPKTVQLSSKIDDISEVYLEAKGAGTKKRDEITLRDKTNENEANLAKEKRRVRKKARTIRKATTSQLQASFGRWKCPRIVVRRGNSQDGASLES